MVNKIDDNELIIENKQLKEAQAIFSERLKLLLADSKLSKEEFADFIGITRQTLTKFESCESLPRLDTLVLISKRLKVSISYLLGETGTQDNEIAKINISEYTGLSQEAIEKLHFTKFLNEIFCISDPNGADIDENHEEKQPYYYYISALLSNSGLIDFEVFENNLEAYCKASKQLREIELLSDKSIERKKEMERKYRKFNNIIRV